MSRFTTTIAGRPVGWLETFDDAVWPSKTVVGTPGDDQLHGGKGNDDIDGLAGADTMAGRLGDDTYHVDNLGDVVKEGLDAGTDTVISNVDWTLGKNVENLTLVGANQNEDLVGIGNKLDNVIVGNAGENRLDGAAGNDLIKSGGTVGPFESDTLVGGEGDDTLIGGAGYITNDLLQGGEGDDVLQVGSGANVLYGGNGSDRLTGGTGDNGHWPNSDTLFGGAGKDTLEGGSFQDGGDGNDHMHIDFAYEANGGAGNDTIEGTGGTGHHDLLVDGGLGDDSVDVYAPVDTLWLYGGAGNDTLRAGSGIKVVIDAGDGDDVVTTWGSLGGSESTIHGGEGNDTLSSSLTASLVSGDAGNDNMIVGGWDSQGEGGAGQDTLSAGHGLVRLYGGADSDRFLLHAKEVEGEDMLWINDFASGVDHLAVSQSALPVGNGDLVVDGAVMVDGPGGFGAGSELVIVTANIDGYLTIDKAAAAIGSADQAYAAGQSVVFMVDNGADSLALYFQSSGVDAMVSAAELSILGHLGGAPATGLDDVIWAG